MIPLGTLVRLAAFTGLALLCAMPLGAVLLPLVLAPLDSGRALMELAGSSRLWGLWGRSVGIALGAAGLALLLGAPLGLLLPRRHGRESFLFAVLLTLPLLLPPHVHAVAWVDLLGQQGLLNQMLAAVGLGPHSFPLYGGPGVALVLALWAFPIPLWCAWHAARRLDPSVTEAARNLGAGRLACARLLLPLYVPAILLGTALVFLLALMSFSVPSLLQTPVFTVEIFTQFNSFLDGTQAALVALPLALTGAAALALAGRAWRTGPWRQPPYSGKPTDPVPSWPRRVALVCATVLLTGLPIFALMIRSLPPGSLLAAWSTGWQEITTSLLVSVITATLLLGVALPLSAPGARWSPVAGMICAGAWLASGPVFGVGLIATWNHAGPPGWIYDHFPILVIATAGRLAIFAWLGARVVWTWWPREAAEAARNLGATPARVFRTVAWPMLRRPLFALWAVVAVLALGEVETLALVSPPGWVPVSLRIFTLMHYGPAALVSALALLQALGAGVILFAAGTTLEYGEFYTRTKRRYHVRGEGNG